MKFHFECIFDSFKPFFKPGKPSNSHLFCISSIVGPLSRNPKCIHRLFSRDQKLLWIDSLIQELFYFLIH